MAQNLILKEAKYLLSSNKTIREMAIIFKRSKSQIQRDLNKLKAINNDLYLEVREVLNTHQKFKHIKGGLATKIKYRGG